LVLWLLIVTTTPAVKDKPGDSTRLNSDCERELLLLLG
jgi:hypothetical protein